MASWIFQDNPDRFDLQGYVAACDNLVWSAKRYAEQIAVGDSVYLWQTLGKEKKASGVLALCTVTGPARSMPDAPDSVPFWRDPAGAAEATLRVSLRVVSRANQKQIIRREWLTEDPICRDLPNLRMPQGTNYPLEIRHATRLARLWERTGRDFDRYELLVCLRAYADTYGRAVSTAPSTPVSDAAIEIGRAVSSVYSKLMNFRALDPRAAGEGQAKGGEPTRMVWDEFWTGDDVDRERLRADYVRLAAPGGDEESLGRLQSEAADITGGEPASEGTRRLVTHLRLERDRRIVHQAKALWLVRDPLLRCEACGMSFLETYGDIGSDFVEAHHRAPLGNLDGPTTTRVEDLAPVCANCHRMLHRRGGLLITELQRRVLDTAATVMR